MIQIINTATYLYKTSVKVGKDINGKTILKHFLFPSFIRENKKTDISKEDYKLLLTHPNFRHRIDLGLIKIAANLDDFKPGLDTIEIKEEPIKKGPGRPPKIDNDKKD